MKWLMRLLGIAENRRDVAPMERALLVELEKRLLPEASSILRRQVACFQYTQWRSKENEAYFGLEPPPELQEQYGVVGPNFPSESEGSLATAVFSAPDSEARYTVDYLVIRGTVAALKCDKAPSPGALQSAAVVIHEFTLHFDPMLSKRMRPKGRTAMKVGDLTGWLRDLAIKHQGQDLQFPFDETEVDARLAGFDTTFPSELKDSATDGWHLFQGQD